VKILRFFWRFIVWFQKFVLKSVALMFAFGIPALAVYDSYFPWEPAQEFLAERADHFIPVHVGFAIEGERVQHSYALLPKSLALPRLLTVLMDTDRVARASDEALGFWLVLALFVYGWYLSLRFFGVVPRSASRA
jgi:hypothetical protein